MRILFRGLDHPSALAKSLKRELAAAGRPLGRGRCEKAIARMTGYPTWDELRKVSLATAVPSPRDGETGPVVAAARRAQYVDALGAILADAALAARVVDAIRPTGARPGSRSAAPPSAPPPTPSGPVTEAEMGDFAMAVLRRELLVKLPAAYLRLRQAHPGRAVDHGAFERVLRDSYARNLAELGARSAPVTRLPDGRDDDLAAYVRHPGLTDDEVQDLDHSDPAARDLAETERELVAAEEAVADAEERGVGRGEVDRVTERYNRVGERAAVAEWAADYPEDED